MYVGRVVGTVVSTIKVPGLAAYKLLIVVPQQADSADGAEQIVAIDLAGAGEGEVVLVSRGSAARVTAGTEAAPIDAAIVAVIDTIQIGARNVQAKG
jgi:microcompartment protein CcmK/EutM